MNVKRFTARTSREALSLVRHAFGEDAVVLSTRPFEDGVEVLAMAPDSVAQMERVAAPATAPGSVPARLAATAPRRAPPPASPPRRASAPAPGPEAEGEPLLKRSPLIAMAKQWMERNPASAAEAGARSGAAPSRFDSRFEDSRLEDRRPRGQRQEPELERSVPRNLEREVGQDVAQLAMSTLSFQDYVRERMLKRRQAERDAVQAEQQRARLPPAPGGAALRERAASAQVIAHPAQAAPYHFVSNATRAALQPSPVLRAAPREAAPVAAPAPRATARPVSWEAEQEPVSPARGAAREVPVLRDELRPAPPPMPRAHAAQAQAAPQLADAPPPGRASGELMDELRAMKGLIEDRFGALAFMEKLQRQPRQATLTQRLLDTGLSPVLIRKLVDSLPPGDGDPLPWAASVLERNLLCADQEQPLEDAGGVFALVGATGVGKTTSTAKIAAAFAARHGAANLGLITLDAYRVAAHEQLRAYGRILGVPVHTAHDRASLEDLLELLAGKKLVLIDTAGMAQRDARTVELLDMLAHASVRRILVVNAAAQGETIEDVLLSYRATQCAGVVLSKLDETVKLAPALDALIRHRLKVLAVANGQRVPEDWHRLSASALVQRALRASAAPAWRMDSSDMNLIFVGMPNPAPVAARPAAGSTA